LHGIPSNHLFLIQRNQRAIPDLDQGGSSEIRYRIAKFLRRGSDPIASMQAIKNPELHAVTGQVRDLPKKAVEAI
jgi:hypothetical protein